MLLRDLNVAGESRISPPEGRGSATLNGERVLKAGQEICEAQGGIEDGSLDRPPAVAIVGMAARLPGGVSTTGELWKFLIEKGDGVCPVPRERYNVHGFHTPGLSYSVDSKQGYFLQQDISQVDTSFFSYSYENEAPKMDPQQRLLLEVVWECFENGGYTGWQGQDIGCYVGSFTEDWAELCSKDPQDNNPTYVISASDFALANRVSYEFDLRGPSMTLKTACSSSLVALHEACQALYSRECSSAIVAGVNLIFSPTLQSRSPATGAISTSGTCKTFDASADGYGRGEAINAILIKRLDKALEDGDVIRAVIRATSVNCDGKTSNMTAPSAEMQAHLIEKTYRKAGIREVFKTGFFECHGTGTAAGDSTEAEAVARAFPEGIYIGSVKPNFGHSEAASGITSVIKAVLSLENRQIPPNIRFSDPSPKIPFKDGKLVVPVDPTPWPSDREERISINNFGIGGTNCHVIIESTRSMALEAEVDKTIEKATTLKLLVVSAKNKLSLGARINGIREYAKAHPEKLQNLVYTLGVRREHLDHRAFILASSAALDCSVVSEAHSTSTPSIAFIFTGQGAQWADMGIGLMKRFKAFRSNMKALDNALQGLSSPPNWKIEEELTQASDMERINKPEFAQTLCCAIQIGLVNLLMSWGVHPAAVVGHSSGEIAAAYAAGVITSECAIIIAYYKGISVGNVSRSGGMAAVGLGREAVEPYVTEGLVIACENSPNSVTLSGDQDELEKTIKRIKTDDPTVLCRRLRVGTAYHSHHMKEVGHDYERLIAPWIALNPLTIPFYSTVTGKRVFDTKKFGAPYWRDNMESPVLFSAGVNSLLAQNEHSIVFLEIGPHPALSGPLRQILIHFKATERCRHIGTLVRNEEHEVSILRTAGELFLAGARLDFEAINGGGKLLTDLPPYPWQRDAFCWGETRVHRDWRLRPFPHHELLGSRILESTDLEPSWRNMLRLQELPWLLDHRIQGKVVFPGAGYIAMAGEALQQITRCDSYEIKNIYFKTALLLKDDSDNEIYTSLRQSRLNAFTDSDWYDFTISSVQKNSVTMHCIGQVRPVARDPPQVQSFGCFSRRINADLWYEHLDHLQVSYGPKFCKLEEITAHPSVKLASAKVHDDSSQYRSRYVIHPIVIDACLQLISVAASNGIKRKMAKAGIPASIGRLLVKPAGRLVDANARIIAINSTSASANITAFFEDEVVIDIQSCVLTLLDSDTDRMDMRHLCWQLRWQPHIDLLPKTELLQTPISQEEELQNVAEICHLLIIETMRRVEPLQPKAEHLHQYKDWLRSQIRRIEKSTPRYTAADESGNTLNWLTITSAQRRATIKALAESTAPALIPITRCLSRIENNCESIFKGEREALEVFYEEDGAKDLYETIPASFTATRFLSSLCHSYPRLRVLEVGAGTGANTSGILPLLHSTEGVPLYSQYLFTDISPGFLSAAMKRFSQYQNIEYSLLDIDLCPMDQGLEPDSFDLIVAANVVHATPSLSRTLTNLRSLLAPGGRLFLMEICSEATFFGLIMGVLPGWWVGQQDGRVDKPHISLERWDAELRQAGFSGVDASEFDPCGVIATIISTIPSSTSATVPVTLLCDDKEDQWTVGLAQCLAGDGYAVHLCKLEEQPSSEGFVISLLDHKEPFFYNMTSLRMTQLQRFLQLTDEMEILWITNLTQTSCRDPRFALTIGFARSYRIEVGRNLATLELEHFDADAYSIIKRVFKKRHTDHVEKVQCRDSEFAYFDGSLNVSRFHWRNTVDCLLSKPQDNARKVINIARPGALDDSSWIDSPSPALSDGDIELDVKAVGVNFKDVMLYMGFFGDVKDMGSEATGVVRRIGAGVKEVNIGDRVMFLADGCYCTRLVIPASNVLPVPAGISFEEAATMMVVYATAIHSLIDLGRLEKDQSVLIHSACGGVGLAAIAICEMIGAQIYVTVGNPEKAQYLIDRFQIPSNRIFNSRSTLFVEDVLRETNGRGVDIVLNSLAGELLHASWECVAEGGKMLELGKRDFLAQATLPMDGFLKRRAFFGVGLDGFMKTELEKRKRLMETMNTYFQTRPLAPIKPVTTFKASELGRALKVMMTGQHMGKLVITIPEDSSELRTQEVKSRMEFSSDSAYVLVGGLGGLGRTISTWMVENGARCLIYLSRSAGRSEEHRDFLETLAIQGCEAITVEGSVTNMEDIQKTISVSPKPIAGILHLAMTLRDKLFHNMTFKTWDECCRAKIEGAQNLHNAFKNVALDFFVMFGSVAATYGSPGQTNYTAANAFLSAFARYRNGLGLPGSVLDLGLLSDVGAISDNTKLMERLRSFGTVQLREENLLDALHLLLKQSDPNGGFSGESYHQSNVIAGLSMYRSAGGQEHWMNDARMATCYSLNQDQPSEQSTDLTTALKEFIKRVHSDPEILNQADTADFLSKEFGRLICPHLFTQTDVDMPAVMNSSVDSMLAIEIRNRTLRYFDLEITLIEISAAGTVGGFVALLIDALRAKHLKTGE